MSMVSPNQITNQYNRIWCSNRYKFEMYHIFKSVGYLLCIQYSLTCWAKYCTILKTSKPKVFSCIRDTLFSKQEIGQNGSLLHRKER